jgi:hypothetical protein
LDYRVRLDFAYIPKNAYEALTFFRIISECDDWTSPPFLSKSLRKAFWKAQEVFKTERRPSSKSSRGPTEVIRDILDMAAYMGLLRKRWSPEDGRTTEFKLTKEGAIVCKLIRGKDIEAQQRLVADLLDYKIPNYKIDTGKYFQFKDFSVRPFFVLMKLLNDFERDYWGRPGRPRFHPKELGYVILAIKKESDEEFRLALDRMQEFSDHGYFKSGNWDLLKRKLAEHRYAIKEFDRKTNNLRTRLFRWPFVLGLLDCRMNIADAETAPFFIKLRGIKKEGKFKRIRVTEVLGLTKVGAKIIAPMLKSRYIYSGLTSSDKILSVALSRHQAEVRKETLEGNAIKAQIYRTPSEFQYGIERLQSHQVVQSNGTVQVQLEPIFDLPTQSEQEEIQRKTEALTRLLAWQAKRHAYREVAPTVVQIPKISSKLLVGKSPETIYLLQGADPELSDYLRLALGEQSLTKRYSDIRQAFEAKTNLILEQMAFKTELYGQSVKRGESYPDIVAIWKRVAEGTDKSHITIIECKTSSRAYNISATDIDDRIRQTKNLLNIEHYRKYGLKALIDSVLFVSSSFGLGNNQQKMRELEERYRQDLRMNVRVAAISAKSLMELYVRYRREPSRFSDYDFLSLFQENVISATEIRQIFGE